jgi:hypothetical protein
MVAKMSFALATLKQAPATPQVKFRKQMVCHLQGMAPAATRNHPAMAPPKRMSAQASSGLTPKRSSIFPRNGRLTNAPTKALLASLCETSRKYQSTVSAALAEQVLEALFELVRGFQSANDATHGELLKQHLGGDDDATQDVAGVLAVAQIDAGAGPSVTHHRTTLSRYRPL